MSPAADITLALGLGGIIATLALIAWELHRMRLDPPPDEPLVGAQAEDVNRDPTDHVCCYCAFWDEAHHCSISDDYRPTEAGHPCDTGQWTPE